MRCRVVDGDVIVRCWPSGPATAAYVPPVAYVDLLHVRERLADGLGARIERHPDGRYAVVVEAKEEAQDPASLARWARTTVEALLQARLSVHPDEPTARALPPTDGSGAGDSRRSRLRPRRVAR